MNCVQTTISVLKHGYMLHAGERPTRCMFERRMTRHVCKVWERLTTDCNLLCASSAICR